MRDLSKKKREKEKEKPRMRFSSICEVQSSHTPSAIKRESQGKKDWLNLKSRASL
jgi:hypothetical protein